MGGVTYVMSNNQLLPFTRQIKNHQSNFSFVLGQTGKLNSRQSSWLYEMLVNNEYSS